MVLLICKDISRKLQLKFLATATIQCKLELRMGVACVLNLTFYIRSINLRTVS